MPAPIQAVNTLLVTLGASPAVVPEAFLMPGGDFQAVHVLTSETVDDSLVREWFAARAPEVALSICRVRDFRDLRTEDDHFRFEEVLFRWWLSIGAARSHVCLSGGFKTMSTAIERAAEVFGAAEVFHVLAELPPRPGETRPRQPATMDEIDGALAAQSIRWIRLGSRPGWPGARGWKASNYPLHAETSPDSTARVSSPDSRLREEVLALAERSRRISEHWDSLAGLPFNELATWSPQDLAWLNDPLDTLSDLAWIEALPKVELHCHLGGFATSGMELEAVRAAAENPSTLPPVRNLAEPNGWPFPTSPIGLEPYRHLGDNNGSALLHDRGCLREQCRRLYKHLCGQNILYAEIRCSPANYSSPGRSPWTVLRDIKSCFDECMNADVEACVPHGLRGVGRSTQDACSHTRLFTPFDKSAEYHQTWRDLPHRHQTGATAFVTFRLGDSIPRGRLSEWVRERDVFLQKNPKPWTREQWQHFERGFPRKLEDWLDEAHGNCALAHDAAASIMEEALRFFDGARYILDAYVVMPNHVHAILKPLKGHDVTSILHSWKSYTAKTINAACGLEGSLWQHESFDHLVRSLEQLEELRRYIADNPRRAGLNKGYRLGCGLGLQSAPGPGGSTPEPCGTHAPTLPRCRVNLLLIGTRQPGGDFRAGISRHLALAVTAADHWRHDPGCQVVGVDLAGFEDASTRAHYFREEFTAIHRCGLALTVHAGENDDAEGIWSAVFDLNARRLGHALHLADCPELLRSVAERGIAVEMCPYANFQIKGFAPMPGRPAYPLLDYLKQGVRVTVNTDNIGISAGSLGDNILQLSQLCPGITRMHILQLLRNAIDSAFLSTMEKSRLLRAVSSRIPLP
jgi:REP element-mobilizing transposase RayT